MTWRVKTCVLYGEDPVLSNSLANSCQMKEPEESYKLCAHVFHIEQWLLECFWERNRASEIFCYPNYLSTHVSLSLPGASECLTSELGPIWRQQIATTYRGYSAPLDLLPLNYGPAALLPPLAACISFPAILKKGGIFVLPIQRHLALNKSWLL